MKAMSLQCDLKCQFLLFKCQITTRPLSTESEKDLNEPDEFCSAVASTGRRRGKPPGRRRQLVGQTKTAMVVPTPSLVGCDEVDKLCRRPRLLWRLEREHRRAMASAVDVDCGDGDGGADMQDSDMDPCRRH